jgi:4-amino-4-deoxy-L-arabinose transferase-like glycosyltransferase
MNPPSGSACSRQVLALIAAVTGVRAILSVQLELTSVESYSWMWARHPALGYYDHPGMSAWLGGLSMAVFGSGVLGFRVLTLACSGGMIWLTFLAARRLFDNSVARLAAALAALVPLFFLYSAAVVPDAPCLLFWSATVWALAHALSGDSPRWWGAAGLFLGLAMDSKYHAAFLGLGVLGFLLGSPEHRPWLRRKEPWIGTALAALAFSPTVLWNALNGWQSFAYQGVSRFGEGAFHPSQLWRFASSQLLLLTPVVAVAAWAFGVAALAKWSRIDWRERFLAALGTPVLIFFAAMVFVRPVRGHWPGPGYLTLLILSAAVIHRGGLWIRRLTWGSLAVLAAGVVLLPAALAFTPKDQRTGWAFLGDEVRLRKLDFVVCDDYHVASQVGYALRTTDSWDLTPVGRPGKSFPNWWDEKSHLGKNAVLVYDARHFPGEMDRIRDCFARVDAPELVVVPRLRLGSFGEDERYWVLNAWGYKGARLLYPRQPDSGD